MEAALTLFFLFGIPIAFVIGFFIYADRWLRKVDKQKYYNKSLKKDLKKGNITESEYEQMINSEVLDVTEIVIAKPVKEEAEATVQKPKE